MKRRGSRFRAAAAVALTLAGVARGESHTALEAGRKAFETGDFDAAIRILGKVAGKPGAPVVRARAYLLIGLSHASRPSRDVRAVERAYRRALELDPTLAVDPVRFPPSLVREFEAVRREIRGTLIVKCGRPNPASVTGVDVVTDASVIVDGEQTVRCGAAIEIVVGKHLVRAENEREKRDFHAVVSAATETVVRVVMSAKKRAAVAKADTGVEARPVRRAPRGTRWTLGWSLVGGGGAMVVAGTVFGVLASSTRSDLNSKQSGYQLTVSEAEDLKGRLSTQATLANVFWVVGGVAAASGAALLLWPRKSNDGAPVLSIRPVSSVRGEVAPVVEGRWEF